MNQLLKNYAIQMDYPTVSGAEHLETLEIRDQLSEIESSFSVEDRAFLFAADRKLMANIIAIHQELSRFIDLAKYRSEQHISPQQWWWYLDVLSYLPNTVSSIEQAPIEYRDAKSA
ncbi:MAG: hypothetical protein LH474_13175 [Chamaesiphon sp.]|nr:hypothetical protein [Chamaesiphon sp.]